MNLLTRKMPKVESYFLYHRLINTAHYDIKSLRYNGLVIWNDFFRNTDDNKNLCNTAISKFKHNLKDLLISQYHID